MCWVSFKQPQVKVAKRNIKVLKVVYMHPSNPMELLPYYFHHCHTYTFNTENPTVLIKIQKTPIGYGPFYKNKKLFYSIHGGYHSYSTKCVCIKDFSIFPNIVTINDIHFYSDDIFTGNRIYLVECIIPKGVRYYLNEFNEYVSENIIIKRLLP